MMNLFRVTFGEKRYVHRSPPSYRTFSAAFYALSPTVSILCSAINPTTGNRLHLLSLAWLRVHSSRKRHPNILEEYHINFVLRYHGHGGAPPYGLMVGLSSLQFIMSV
jgi:hypothetical protein